MVMMRLLWKSIPEDKKIGTGANGLLKEWRKLP
jgi:hypothetical protein